MNKLRIRSIRWGRSVKSRMPQLSVARAVVALAALTLVGCAVFASKSEYASYRQIRLEDDERQQLIQMQAYMAEYPSGIWAQQVQAKRMQAEPEAWASAGSSREGLEAYLAAFPDSPRAEEGRSRLAALQTVQGRRDQEAEQAREVERQRREVLLERRRTWMTRAGQFWVRTMVSITNWGSPIGDVARQNEAFSRAFGTSPRPRCSATECIKFYRADYAIPVPGSTQIDRQLEMLLRLRMTEGNVTRAEILLPNKGFSRWYEQEHREIVVDEDPEQRQRAINWAIERLLPALREVAPNAAAIDVVSEPIDPPTVRAPNQAEEGSALAPGDEPEEEETEEEAPPAETPPGDTPPATEPTALELLLNEASGGVDTPEETTAPVEEPPPAQEPEAMVLPIALQGYQAGSVRIVIFAASDEDYGTAYDGLFIEYDAPEPVEPPRRGRRRR